MTRTIPTLAVLMAATLLTAAAANAQEARGAQAFPPGPNVDATAYPPGPTAQAGTNTTTNVNVVNAPTVQVGNEVAVKEPVTKGTFWPTTIFASSLSSVTRFGVERMLPSALVCRKRASADSA